MKHILVILLGVILGLSPQLKAQTRVLSNEIIGWETRRGFMGAGFIDESALDVALTYVHWGLRMGFQAGISAPAQTGIERSPGLLGYFMFFPNEFHSRVDPFFHVRLHANFEEGKFTEDRLANSVSQGRPVAFLLRAHAGYGFNVYMGRYLYLQHILGLGSGFEFYEGAKPLSRVSLVISFGMGFHLFNYMRDRKRDQD